MPLVVDRDDTFLVTWAESFPLDDPPDRSPSPRQLAHVHLVGDLRQRMTCRPAVTVPTQSLQLDHTPIRKGAFP